MCGGNPSLFVDFNLDQDIMNIALLLIFTLSSLASFLAILFSSDPYHSQKAIIFLFFVTMFLSIMGVFSLTWILGSKIGSKKIEYAVSLRRAFLLSALVTSLVLLEKYFVLNIGNTSSLFLLIVGVEMIFIYKNNK